MSKQISPRYDAAFQRRAADQVLHHQPVAAVARQFHCSPQSVANWVKQYQNAVRSNHSLPPSPKFSPIHPPHHSSSRSPKHSPKSKSTLPHPTVPGYSCQPKKPLPYCSRSAKPPSRCTTFLPVEVGEVSSFVSCSESLASCNESLMPRDASRLEIVTQSGWVLRLPGETALDVLAGLVHQLESASVPPAQQQRPPAQS